MKHRLTASKIKLARRCLWWARRDVEIPPGEETSAARVGTAFHSAAEEERLDEDAVDRAFAAVVGPSPKVASGLSAAEQRKLDRLVAAWRAWIEQGLLTGIDREVPVALSMSGEGRRLERTGPRDYSQVCEDELPGTADVVAIWAPNDGTSAHLFVGDYKTGRSGDLDDHLDQLTHLATAIARDEGADAVRVGVIHVQEWGVELETRVLDGLDLAVHAEEVGGMLAALVDGDPQPAPGLHCEDLYCPARAVCPATRALLVDAGVELEPRRRLPIVGPVTSNDQACAILVAAPMVEAWIAERVKAARAYADDHDGVRAPDGRVYRARAQKRETPRLDVDGAIEALRAVLGPDADAAVRTKVSTSFDAIKEVIAARRARGEKLPIKGTIERARDALREIGALKVSEFETYDWADESPKKGKES